MAEDDAGGWRVVETAVLPADDAAGVVGWLATTARQHGPVWRVAIDAPSALSDLVHANDMTLSAKFRVARCGEIALGRDLGVWVPWVSPPATGAAPVAPWITVGLSLFAALTAAGIEAIETFPQAIFRVRNQGARVAPKSKPEGLAERVALLRGAGVDEPTLPLWGHDGLDAAAAALVAADPASRAITCGHDGSAIWVPPSPPTDNSAEERLVDPSGR